MSEINTMRQIQIAVSKLGVRLFRNNTGMIKQQDGRIVRFGLCIGGSDLIGFTPVIISPEMIGETLAVFTAVEVKSRKGRMTKQQESFISAVRGAGGIAIIARSVEDAMSEIMMTPIT